MAASSRQARTGPAAQEPPSGLWGFCAVASHKCGNFALKKLKDLSNFVVQYATSALVISVIINSIWVPSLEHIVLPTCETILMAGTTATYWLQSCSARGTSMRIQKKKGRALGMRKIKREMYLASLAKLDDAYCDAARKYKMPVRRFALLLPSARKRWMSIYFPHSGVSFGGVRASLAKAENDAHKHFKAWQAAIETVKALEDDIVAADAAANVAKDKQHSCYQAMKAGQPL